MPFNFVDVFRVSLMEVFDQEYIGWHVRSLCTWDLYQVTDVFDILLIEPFFLFIDDLVLHKYSSELDVGLLLFHNEIVDF